MMLQKYKFNTNYQTFRMFFLFVLEKSIKFAATIKNEV